MPKFCRKVCTFIIMPDFMWWNAVMFFSFLCIYNLFYVSAGKDVQQNKYIRKVKKG